MRAIAIEIDGCDDTTRLNANLPEDVVDHLIAIANAMNETRTSGCMPSFNIFELDFCTQAADPNKRLTKVSE